MGEGQPQVSYDDVCICKICVGSGSIRMTWISPWDQIFGTHLVAKSFGGPDSYFKIDNIVVLPTVGLFSNLHRNVVLYFKGTAEISYYALIYIYYYTDLKNSNTKQG